MTEQQASGEQTSNEEQSQADLQQGADQQQESRQTQDSQESREITDLPDWAQKIIRDERKESAKYRGKVKEYEDASKTEAEKRDAALKDAVERASRAEQALQEANGWNAVYSNAGNARDAELLYLYVEKQGIEFGEDGRPVNVKDLIEQARKDKPSLFERGSADGAARSSEKTYEPEPGRERMTYAYEESAKRR